MTIYWSESLRNGVLDAIETTIGTSPKVRIYAGSVPADTSAGIGGATLLVEFSLASDWMGNATAGAKTFSGVPLSETAVATGVASFYRIYKSDGSTCMEQGTVASSGGDMDIDNTSISGGQTVRITSWKKTAPHAP